MDLLDLKVLEGTAKDYWFFVAREELLYYFVDRFSDNNQFILNIGCGISIKKDARKYRHMFNIDIDERLLPLLETEIKKRFLVMDACQSGFKEEVFDMVIMSDVLEHLKDDERSLTEAYRVLKRNGYLIINVPAFPFLFGPMDIYERHFRRYTKSSLIRFLKNNFKIVKMSYWMFFMFIPASLMKLFKKMMLRKSKSDFIPLPKYLNKFLLFIARLENYFMRKINLPIGTTIFLIVQKI